VEKEVEEVSISMSVGDLAKSVSERIEIKKEEAEKVIYAFIDYYLKKFKLK